jgi:hypothetical protein
MKILMTRHCITHRIATAEMMAILGTIELQTPPRDAHILFTFKIEFSAIIIYMLASGFNFLAEKIFYQPVSMMFKSIALLVTSIFMFVDVVLLTVSVLVTEILCWLAHLLCALFGGPRSGSEWHQ